MGPSKPLNPFGSADIALADAIELSSTDLLAYYAKLETCGIECQAVKAQVQSHLDFAKAIKEQFGQVGS